MVMSKLVISVFSVVAAVLTTAISALTLRASAEMNAANSISTFCRCPGRRPSVRPLPSGTFHAVRRRNAVDDRIHSWCMACGRNTKRAFQNIAKSQHRD